MLDQGVDVILPVGGPIYKSAAAAITDSGKDTLMLGVDSDLAVADDSVAGVTLVSIMKAIDVAVYDATIAASKGEFDPTPYIGTLKNEGTGLSPFHEFAGKVPAEVSTELDQIRADIVSGRITITSPAQPK